MIVHMYILALRITVNTRSINTHTHPRKYVRRRVYSLRQYGTPGRNNTNALSGAPGRWSGCGLRRHHTRRRSRWYVGTLASCWEGIALATVHAQSRAVTVDKPLWRRRPFCAARIGVADVVVPAVGMRAEQLFDCALVDAMDRVVVQVCASGNASCAGAPVRAPQLLPRPLELGP